MTTKSEKEIITTDTEDGVVKLSERAVELDTKNQPELRKEVVKALKDTMRKYNIKSLSAPAIGYNVRIFCIDMGIEIKTFINPMPIEYGKDVQTAIETCTSIPGKRFIRFRPNTVRVAYQRPTGALEEKEFKGWVAVVVQHELEHLEGIVLSDFGLEIDDNWETLPNEDKDEILKDYMDELDLLTEEINKEIIENPDLKELSDGIDFMTKVASGEVKLEKI